MPLKIILLPQVLMHGSAVYADGSHSGGLEIIEVTGHKTNLIGDAISSSEGRISQDELAQRPLLRTGEILETVPGLVATQHSGSGKANQYFLRGFNLDHGTDFATSIDHMPINMRSHGHGQGYTDLNFIIPELVGEIAYKKGAYYPDVGDFSGSGSASIHTIDKVADQRLSLGWGENDFSRLLSKGQIPLATGNILYGLEVQHYNGPWDDISEEVKKTNLWLKQRWSKGSDEFNLLVMGYDNSWNSADQIPARAVTQDIISELGSIDKSLGGESSRYSLSASWARKLTQAKVEASAYVIDYDLQLWSNFNYFVDTGGNQFEQVDERRIYGGDFSYSQSGQLLAKPVSNTWGVQWRYDDIAKVGLFNSRERTRTDVFRLDAVEEYSLSAYWENRWQWSDKLRSVLGIRYDYFNFNVDTLAARVAATLNANQGRRDDSIATTSLSVVYTFNPSYEGYISAGQGFHSNDARGVTLKLNPNTGESLDAVDPLVDTLGYEVGLRTYLTDRLNASFALWHLDIDSELIFVGDEGTTEDTGVGSKRDGLEVTAYFYVDERWTFDFEYAYTRARFREKLDGSRSIPGALKTVVSAGINTHWTDNLYSHLRLRHFGDYPLDGGETADDSTLVNLRIGYQVSSALSFSLDILNLLDSNDRDIEYVYESQLASETEPVNDHHYHVFEPRTLRAYVNYSF